MRCTHCDRALGIPGIGNTGEMNEFRVRAFGRDAKIPVVAGRADHDDAGVNEPVDGLTHGRVSASIVLHVLRETQWHEHDVYGDAARPCIEGPYDLERDQRVLLLSDSLVIDHF
jgi:hypothetical protein